jgi:hypothetical protein
VEGDLSSLALFPEFELQFGPGGKCQIAVIVLLLSVSVFSVFSGCRPTAAQGITSSTWTYTNTFTDIPCFVTFTSVIASTNTLSGRGGLESNVTLVLERQTVCTSTATFTATFTLGQTAPSDQGESSLFIGLLFLVAVIFFASLASRLKHHRKKPGFRCPTCEREVVPRSRFCENRGTALEWDNRAKSNSHPTIFHSKRHPTWPSQNLTFFLESNNREKYLSTEMTALL